MKNTAKENSKVIEIDAESRSLGRVASEVAMTLSGKRRVSYERNNANASQKVKVINASKLKMTEKKLENLRHIRYSGEPGGLKVRKANYTSARFGCGRLIELAVKKMLPDNKLRKGWLKNLEVEE